MSQKLHDLADRLRKARIDDDYVETDLHGWTIILEKLKNEIINISPLITIQEDSTKFIGKINVTGTIQHTARTSIRTPFVPTTSVDIPNILQVVPTPPPCTAVRLPPPPPPPSPPPPRTAARLPPPPPRWSAARPPPPPSPWISARVPPPPPPWTAARPPPAAGGDPTELLRSIRDFRHTKLKKTKTNDRSGPKFK